jgi:predicted secreted protein/copper chaperone CopZ
MFQRELGGLFLLAKVGPMPALPAELTIADLTFEAKTPGVGGNAVSVEYAAAAVPGTIDVSVTVSAIKVGIDTGTTLAEEIKAALDASSPATALIKTVISGDPKATQVITAPKNLAYGYDATTSAQMLAGLRTKKLTLGAEAIDVTNHSSDSYKTVLDKCGVRSFSMDAGGVATSTTVFDMISIICEKNLLQQFLLVDVVNQITRKGYFKIASLEKGADFNKEQTFSIKLESSGRLTKNPATASEMDDSI